MAVDGVKPGITSIDNHEIEHHSKLANVWWDELGDMRALHYMNGLRVQFIVDGLINTGRIHPEAKKTSQPLKGIKVLEVGCGGGIFTEPLAGIGADVTGVDASHDLIEVARLHSRQNACVAGRIEYIHDTIENHARTHGECYDAVIASEVLEHITQKDLFLSALTETLKPGGSVFITTFNKTFFSWAGGIIAAEYVLRLGPMGSHQWKKFISPQKTRSLLEKNNCSTVIVKGMFYKFWAKKNRWVWIPNQSINYALQAVKNKNGINT